MNRFDTEGLDLDMGQLTSRLATSFSQPQPGDTSEPSESTTTYSNTVAVFGPVRSAIASVITAFGTTLVGHNNSQSVHPVLVSMACYVREEREERMADFFEPVRFNWTRQLYQARAAAQDFSRNTYADYSDCD